MKFNDISVRSVSLIHVSIHTEIYSEAADFDPTWRNIPAGEPLDQVVELGGTDERKLGAEN